MILGAAALLVLAAARPSADARVTVAAVGDVMLGRSVGMRAVRRGPEWAFSRVGDAIGSADIAIANLEGPLTRRRPVTSAISLPAGPWVARALEGAGFDLLSVANNHALDCGSAGLADTLSNLRRARIAAVGAGNSAAMAAAPIRRTIHGVRLAFVALLGDMPGLRLPRANGPTIALASRGAVRAAVVSARKASDVVIVSLHVGAENTSRPNAQQIALCREAVAAGADLVIGHHPHRLQALEVRPGPGGRTALVAYSLGNFVFDAPLDADRDTAILTCEFTRDGLVSARLIPYRIRGGRPTPPTPAERRRILDRLSDLSAERHTQLRGGDVVLRTEHRRRAAH